MSDAPRRRHSDRVSASPTFIGLGSKLTGNLACEGDLVVAGEVDGEGVVKGALTLSEGSRWDGKIDAVVGTMAVSEKLEIRKTARIRGIVQARTIAVAQGAIIEGEMAVTSGAPVVSYEEKRKE
jgi:cytoskeletal protein CcmA (bactofilin family)